MINWFEGGRRIFGVLCGILLLIGAGFVVFGGDDNPVILETKSPSDPLKWTLDECKYPDQSKSWTEKHAFGDDESRTVTACFRTNKNGNIWYDFEEEQKIQLPKPSGTSELPPPISYRKMMAVEPFTEKAETYMIQRMDDFTMPKAEYEKIKDNQWMIGWVRFWNRVKETSPWVAGGLFGLWILTAITGWIVRGFAGIPHGRDFRSDSFDTEMGSRSSADWIAFSGAGVLVLGGIAWAISAGTNIAAPQISKAISKFSILIVGLLTVGFACAGGIALWVLFNRLRSKKMGEIDTGMIFGMTIANIMIVGLASWILTAYTPIGDLVEKLDQWSRTSGYSDVGTVGLFAICLLWPLLPLFFLSKLGKTTPDVDVE